MSNVDPENTRMNPSACEGKVVPVSKKTTVVHCFANQYSVLLGHGHPRKCSIFNTAQCTLLYMAIILASNTRSANWIVLSNLSFQFIYSISIDNREQPFGEHQFKDSGHPLYIFKYFLTLQSLHLLCNKGMNIFLVLLYSSCIQTTVTYYLNHFEHYSERLETVADKFT